jgi:hypothetical protein
VQQAAFKLLGMVAILRRRYGADWPELDLVLRSVEAQAQMLVQDSDHERDHHRQLIRHLQRQVATLTAEVVAACEDRDKAKAEAAIWRERYEIVDEERIDGTKQQAEQSREVQDLKAALEHEKFVNGLLQRKVNDLQAENADLREQCHRLEFENEQAKDLAENTDVCVCCCGADGWVCPQCGRNRPRKT